MFSNEFIKECVVVVCKGGVFAGSVVVFNPK